MSEQPIDIWRRKLQELQKAEAVASSAAQKFEIREQMKEAEQRIAELESDPVVASPDPIREQKTPDLESDRSVQRSASGSVVRLIRVFVSSPGDVQAERDLLPEVIRSINRTDGDEAAVRLELFRWEDDVVPQSGPSPQRVIDAQTPAYDIYIGIMSARFGTPTSRYGSGTEKEYRAALKNWKKAGAPWVLFYFDDSPKSISKSSDVEQYLKVSQFREKLANEGLYATYVGARGAENAFFEKVSDHLRGIVRDLRKRWRDAAERASDPVDGGPPPKPKLPPAYIEWLVSRCGDLELMGLELKHGSGVRLNHVYTPLATTGRVQDEPATRKGRRSSTEPSDESMEHEGPQLLLDLLNDTSLYVSGAPGSGKSTFCRWVTWLTCNDALPEADVPAPDGYRESFPEKLRGRLPVLVRLRAFWPELPPAGVDSVSYGELQAALARWLGAQRYPDLEWSHVDAHLASGAALMILDGVDEVPPVGVADGTTWHPRAMLIAGLSDAVARWTKAGNRVLVTSRPYGLDAEQQRRLGLNSAAIGSLDHELQALLVRRWFHRLKEDHGRARETADAMLQHIRVERGLHELASNPLLLTAMCIIYDEGKRLPHDKYLLYDRIVDTVLHKRYQGKESIEPIRGRLSAVALAMHTGEQIGRQREAPEATVSDHEIDLSLQAYQQLDGATDKGLSDTVRVREDLLSQSGLLINRGDGSAAFYHLSIQEFLAAERLFVLHGRSQKELAELFLSRGRTAGWRNTLGLLFGDLVDKFKPHAGVECLREVTGRIQLPGEGQSPRGESGGAWNQAVVCGDCLQILSGRASAIPDDLLACFQQYVTRAIEREIAVTVRQTLAVALGRLGADPRVESDLRWGEAQQSHPGFVRVAAGNYVVGDDKTRVVIDAPFWLSRFPVTNLQYAGFIAADGYQRKEFWAEQGWQWRESNQIVAPALALSEHFNAPTQPVVGVSWWEADAYCRWAGGRLPSEHEWEAAARGLAGRKYPWGDQWEDGVCNSLESGMGVTSVVGLFPRSRSAELGLEDMAGNVLEWCADMDGSDRVIRGGSWTQQRRVLPFGVPLQVRSGVPVQRPGLPPGPQFRLVRRPEAVTSERSRERKPTGRERAEPPACELSRRRSGDTLGHARRSAPSARRGGV